MLARLRKNLHDDEGFTLIELLVVIIIIGILAAIAIPVFLNQRVKGWESAVKSDLKTAATAEETYLPDNAGYANATDLKANTKFSTDNGVVLDSVTQYAPVGSTTYTSGYCLVAHNTKGGKFFYYDSLSGGLKNTGEATQALAEGKCTAAGSLYAVSKTS